MTDWNRVTNTMDWGREWTQTQAGRQASVYVCACLCVYLSLCNLCVCNLNLITDTLSLNKRRGILWVYRNSVSFVDLVFFSNLHHSRWRAQSPGSLQWRRPVAAGCMRWLALLHILRSEWLWLFPKLEMCAGEGFAKQGSSCCHM